jgi:hypothetical protein
MHRPNSDSNGDGLIRMLMHRLIDCFGSLDGLVLDAFQRGRETFAGFSDFFSGHVSGGGHQGARVFGQRAQVIFMCMFCHIFLSFLFVRVFQR